MERIITAIGNPIINKKLKENRNIKIIGKDIQYREAILEILEKNKNINYIILSEKIPGEIDIENLIKKIFKINKKINIIFLLKQENKEKEIILKKLNVKEIYLEKKLNIKKIINIIEDKNKTNDKKIKKEIKENKIIVITGLPKSGKTTITILFTKILLEKNKKILLINLNKKIENNYLKLIKINNKKIKGKKEIILNKNFSIIYNFKNIIENRENYINKIFEEKKRKYDYILIDMGNSNKEKIKKEVYKNSNKILFLFIRNIFKIKKILEKENNKFLNQEEKLYLIQNKYFLKSIDSKITKNLLNKKIYKIFFNEKYKYLSKKILKKEKIKINKITKNYLYKIIK